MTEMTGIGKLIEKYGISVTAVIIIFGVFVWLILRNFKSQDLERADNNLRIVEDGKRSIKIQEEHNANQVKALEKVAESNNNVASALELIRDMFVDRTNAITNKQDILLGRFTGHCTDVNRIETLVVKISESVLKTDERTKQCAERSFQNRKGDE